MSEIDNCKKNKNYNCVKLVKVPISGEIFPDSSRKEKFLRIN